MFAQNPKKEFVVKFDEASIKKAVLKVISSEPSDFTLVKNDEILNEIRIHRKGVFMDLGYHVDFTFTKIAEAETNVIVEVSRRVGTLSNHAELTIASNILKSITSKFSAYLSGDVNPQTGKANLPKAEGCYIATSVYGSYEAPEVILLRKFRDKYLNSNFFGRGFVKIYYSTSPTFVEMTKDMKQLNSFIKRIFDIFLKKTRNSD
jgi:hypothetical protein